MAIDWPTRSADRQNYYLTREMVGSIRRARVAIVYSRN